MVVEPTVIEDVFVVSDMTVEVHRFTTGTVIGFNGVTEWALDSVEQDSALWLPREEQLRTLLGGTFRALERGESSWTVTTERQGFTAQFSDADPEQAYAKALVELLDA